MPRLALTERQLGLNPCFLGRHSGLPRAARNNVEAPRSVRSLGGGSARTQTATAQYGQRHVWRPAVDLLQREHAVRKAQRSLHVAAAHIQLTGGDASAGGEADAPKPSLPPRRQAGWRQSREWPSRACSCTLDGCIRLVQPLIISFMHHGQSKAAGMPMRGTWKHRVPSGQRCWVKVTL